MRYNPYTELKREACDWIRKAMNPQRVAMWSYPKESLRQDQGWRLDELAERVRAADQLGYDVRLLWKDDGLHVQYVKRMPDVPHWY